MTQYERFRALGILLTEMEEMGVSIPEDVEERMFQIIKEFDDTVLGQQIVQMQFGGQPR